MLVLIRGFLLYGTLEARVVSPVQHSKSILMMQFGGGGRRGALDFEVLQHPLEESGITQQINIRGG